MKKWMPMTALTTCGLLGLFLVAASGTYRTARAADGDNKMQSTRADFKEFCQAMQGRWIGEVIWITDWPGFGKKGDKVTAYSDFRISHNGHVLLGRFNGGPGAGTGMVHYDAGKRQIQARWVSSGGSVWNQVIYKQDGLWHELETGSVADGKPIRSSLVRHISNDGKTHRRSGTVKIDGKMVDPVRDVWRRIGD